jgi:hypothetical protein
VKRLEEKRLRTPDGRKEVRPESDLGLASAPTNRLVVDGKFLKTEIISLNSGVIRYLMSQHTATNIL